MFLIGKTLILDETEAPFQGNCTTEAINKANNVLRIHSESGRITFLKLHQNGIELLTMYSTTMIALSNGALNN